MPQNPKILNNFLKVLKTRNIYAVQEDTLKTYYVITRTLESLASLVIGETITT